jgi:ADP-ribose pyrophosphatase
VTVPRATLPKNLASLASLTLPAPPTVELDAIAEARLGEGGFLTLRRMELVSIQADGARSASFPYDVVGRRALDASVMVAHHAEADGRVYVWLRSCLRPPLALRAPDDGPGRTDGAVLWEVPAGLVEPGESPRAGAARELAEELGFVVEEGALLDLGPPTLPAPALLGEWHHFFHVVVDPAARAEPDGDGSPVEAGAAIVAVPLDEALAACRRGDLHDEKTELALRRLADVLAGP